MLSPCMDCSDRFIGCHSECFKYILYKCEVDIIKHEKVKCQSINKRYGRWLSHKTGNNRIIRYYGLRA